MCVVFVSICIVRKSSVRNRAGSSTVAKRLLKSFPSVRAARNRSRANRDIVDIDSSFIKVASNVKLVTLVVRCRGPTDACCCCCFFNRQAACRNFKKAPLSAGTGSFQKSTLKVRGTVDHSDDTSIYRSCWTNSACPRNHTEAREQITHEPA